MYCSNCGAPLPENGICTNCGVPAQNMTFTGNMQGRPAVPQQPFYNPNPMYVQYQGSNMGCGQPYVQQENVAIRGIKDPNLVARIGGAIKESCGSMMMVMVALLVTVAMIFSFVDVIYTLSNATYFSQDNAMIYSLISLMMRCIPFVFFTIGAWMIVFQGYGTYNGKMYGSNACMSTSGFSTIQAGGILLVVEAGVFALLCLFLIFMAMIAGTAASFENDSVLGNDAAEVLVGSIFIAIALTLMIIMSSSLISQMSKIKHAIRGRNYENISVLLPVLLFIMASLQIVSLVYSAYEGEIFDTLICGIFALSYAVAACGLLYVRSKANSCIMYR